MHCGQDQLGWRVGIFVAMAFVGCKVIKELASKKKYMVLARSYLAMFSVVGTSRPYRRRLTKLRVESRYGCYSYSCVVEALLV